MLVELVMGKASQISFSDFHLHFCRICANTNHALGEGQGITASLLGLQYIAAE